MYDKELYTASKCRGTFNLLLGESANKSAVAMCQPLSRQGGLMLPYLCGAVKAGVKANIRRWTRYLVQSISNEK